MQRLQNALIVGTIIFLPFIYRSEIIDPALTPRFLVLSAVLLLILINSLVRWAKSSERSDSSVLRRAIAPVILGYLVVSALAITQALCLSEAIFDFCRTTVGVLTFHT